MKNRFPLWHRCLPARVRDVIEHRPNLQKALVNTGWLFWDKVLRMAVGLVVGVWVARYLGPTQFGLMSYAMALVAMSSAVAGLGLHGVVVRDLVQDSDNVNTTLGTAFVLQLLGGVVGLGLAMVVISWARPDDCLARLMVMVLGLVMVFKAADVVNYWFESEVRSKYVVWAENGAFLVLAAVKGALILAQAPLMAFVWAAFAEGALVAAGLLAVYVWQGGKLHNWRPRLNRAKSLLQDSWPLLLSGLAIVIYMRIGQIMLGQMHGDGAVGMYAAAARIGEMWYFMPVAIVTSVFPALAQARQTSSVLYQARLQSLFDGLTVFSLLVAVATTVVATPLMGLLYGDEYRSGGAVLSVLVWCGVFSSLSVASGRWYLLEGMQRLALSRNLCGVAVNILSNWLLIPRYGAMGAAYSALLAQVCAAVLFDLTLRATRDLFFMKLRALLLITPLRRLWSR